MRFYTLSAKLFVSFEGFDKPEQKIRVSMKCKCEFARMFYHAIEKQVYCFTKLENIVFSIDDEIVFANGSISDFLQFYKQILL